MPLLGSLGVQRLAVGGAATDACVLCTAIDAHVRGVRVAVLEDLAAATRGRGERALDLMRESLGLCVCSWRAWLAQLGK
ncbi:cysteine hydrolase family protein [Dyella sedimenti]|uniref:cysteine hydrolase family protein n=1 Tax=Dyella sedimenti TaxID=2919947 RepID=UPI00242ACB3B|nr:isochorismatase family protein [Dyella sedimenti]